MHPPPCGGGGDKFVTVPTIERERDAAVAKLIDYMRLIEHFP